MDEILRNISPRGLAEALSDIILPRVCVVCGQELSYHERHICTSCLADLPLTHFWEYSHNRMADSFNERISGHIPDGLQEEYAYAAALFLYNSESEYKGIAWDLKYRASLGEGRYFAGMLGRKLSESEFFSDVDVVIPVPLHWRRKLSRGYNQSEVIARAVASELGAECLTDVLRRRRYTKSQTRMGMNKKASNVMDAFECMRPVSAGHILLVDDTFTTGSTLSACHKALRQMVKPSVRISVATLACVTF